MEASGKAVKPSRGADAGLFAACSFADLGLHPTLCQQLKDRMEFDAPTKIQAQAIPAAISGRHVLVKAATGTGKTLVYLAPIIHLLQMQEPRIERSHGTFGGRIFGSIVTLFDKMKLTENETALVLVPTRELCMQVYEIVQKLLHRFHWIVPGYIMGGENRNKEKARLRKGISILIATPGRLLDHLKNTSSFTYSNLRWIVFDEADRILELGFGKSIEEILDILGARQNNSVSSENKAAKLTKITKQNLLLSATLNEKVNRLANISLENPVTIGLDDEKVSSRLHAPSVKNLLTLESDSDKEEHLDALPIHSVESYNLPAQLIQRYVKVSCGSRLVALLSILRNSFEKEVSQKIVVFLSTCDAVDFHYSLLSQFQWSPNSQPELDAKKAFVRCTTFHLHGNMEHNDRRASFHGFISEKSALLLCTDVAARGLDFPKVKCIIQYDSPGEASEYVHRVGRTARLGEKGEALLFLQPVEIDYLNDLQRHGVSLKEYPLQKVLDSFPRGQKHYNKKLLSLDMHPLMLTLQKALENFISSESKMKSLAKDAFCSWVRAYTAHRGELKRIFMVKKLHLGHVARSFGLKEQPSLVGRSFIMQQKKRKKNQRQGRPVKRKRISA